MLDYLYIHRLEIMALQGVSSLEICKTHFGPTRLGSVSLGCGFAYEKGNGLKRFERKNGETAMIYLFLLCLSCIDILSFV